MPNTYHAQETAYDHLDGTGLFDAATIREMADYETDGDNRDFTAEAIAARTGNIALTGAEVADSRERWVKIQSLSRDSYDGDLEYASPEQKTKTSAAVAEQKKLIVPMRTGKE